MNKLPIILETFPSISFHHLEPRQRTDHSSITITTIEMKLIKTHKPSQACTKRN